MKRPYLTLSAITLAGGLVIPGLVPSKAASSGPNVGLSLFFRDGVMAPITFVGNPARHLQEIDIISTSPPGTADVGIQPLITSGDLAVLDWTGVKQVEEEWKAGSGGTYTRVRYYRGANWMTRRSTFTLTAVNVNGTAAGTSITEDAGYDNRRSESLDDAWVRRFVARQTATGCPAMNNCTGATYVAQGLVQLRDSMHPNRQAQVLGATATALELRWSESTHLYRVGLNHVDASAFSFGYGFSPLLELVNRPLNGLFFRPGDHVQLRITLRDGAGRRLHSPGSLPTYRQVMSGQDTSGIRYYNPTLNPQVYYALKHRESNSMVTLAGPTDKMTTAKETGTIDITTPQVITATAAVDGFSALIVGFPPFGVTRGSASWDTPVSDIVAFTIPADAKPGTYVAAMKARREFGGEALNRGAIVNVAGWYGAHDTRFA